MLKDATEYDCSKGTFFNIESSQPIANKTCIIILKTSNNLHYNVLLNKTKMFHFTDYGTITRLSIKEH